MERALTEPGLGYYATGAERPTRGGDFLTAPELHPFFGRLVGRQLHEIWQRLGEPGTFTVREFGAGRGTLGATVRSGLAADASGLANALVWEPLDVRGNGRRGPVASPPITGALVANEFADALPVHRVVQRADRLLERFVAWRDGWFADVEGPPSTGRLGDVLASDGVTLADGQLAEISLSALDWAEGLGPQLERGAVIIVDYGHPAAELYGLRRMAGSLLTYRGHQVGDDPFAFVGQQDITAHVDLTAVDRAAVAGGLERLGRTTQALFLARLGLGELLDGVGREPGADPEPYLLARASTVRLLDPRQLGGFAVLAWGRGLDLEPPLRGFAGPTR